jgi:transcriptional regulator with XRE-family HTH domain
MRARRLRSVISKLKINQCDLAKAAKLNRSVLNQFIKGRTTVSDEQLDAIEAAVRKIASAQLEKVLQVLTPAA